MTSLLETSDRDKKWILFVVFSPVLFILLMFLSFYLGVEFMLCQILCDLGEIIEKNRLKMIRKYGRILLFPFREYFLMDNRILDGIYITIVSPFIVIVLFCYMIGALVGGSLNIIIGIIGFIGIVLSIPYMCLLSDPIKAILSNNDKDKIFLANKVDEAVAKDSTCGEIRV